MSHTPGPWHHGEDKQGRKRVYADRHEIVRALSTHGLRKVPEAERNANRNLIAAAPELYRLLNNLVAAWEQGDIEIRLIAEARDVLAKAEGRK